MKKIPSEPNANVLKACRDQLKSVPSAKLDEYYRQFWRYLQNTQDQYTNQSEIYWATIFAIEELRQYSRGQANAVRFG